MWVARSRACGEAAGSRPGATGPRGKARPRHPAQGDGRVRGGTTRAEDSETGPTLMSPGLRKKAVERKLRVSLQPGRRLLYDTSPLYTRLPVMDTYGGSWSGVSAAARPAALRRPVLRLIGPDGATAPRPDWAREPRPTGRIAGRAGDHKSRVAGVPGQQSPHDCAARPGHESPTGPARGPGPLAGRSGSLRDSDESGRGSDQFEIY